MRNILTYLLIGLLGFGLMMNEASAKRFGGGRSFGVQRSHSSLFSSPNVSQPMKSMGQRTNSRKWGGVLGGLLVGGLLASLFMANGFGAGLLSWLILGSVLLFIISFLRRKMQPGLQAGYTSSPKQSSYNDAANFYSGNVSNSSFSTCPADFDPEAFLRDVKVKFMRLQAAYDQKNLQDLQEFTAPEVFAEIKMQLDERGEKPNKTEVISLNAELLNVAKQADSMMASVRFTGSIRENSDTISQLDEIWHFRQFFNSKSWVVGGIQQEVYEAR